MEYKLVESTEMVWCPNDDRYIIIFKKDTAVIGLNYMQGDDVVDFRRHYNSIDEELTDFYNAIGIYLSGETELDRINQAIWANFNYRNLRNERWFNIVKED
jgi:hypothetical protein